MRAMLLSEGPAQVSPLEVAEELATIAVKLVGVDRLIVLVAKLAGNESAGAKMLAVMYAANDVAVDAIERQKLGEKL
jgi:hypothetical protein